MRSGLYRNPLRSGYMSYRSRVMWYGAAVAAVASATALTYTLRTLMGPSISLLFFPAVIITAVYGGYRPGLFATILSTPALAFFFFAPGVSFDVRADDLIPPSGVPAPPGVTPSISS